MAAMSHGDATHVTRVEAWECDFNGHWNARFYGRGFQAALENIAFRSTGRNPGGKALSRRLIRFHDELLSGELARVDSWRVTSGVFAGSILHKMSGGGGRLAATALDVVTFPVAGLPEITDATGALPRSVPFDALPERPTIGARHDLDPIRAGELDAFGALIYEDVVRRCGVATHAVLDGLGFDRRLTEESRISRMAVEQAIWRLGDLPARQPTRVITRVHALRSKAFSLSQRLEGMDGSPVAAIETCIVAVNLDTRRAAELPAAFREAVAAQPR